MTENQDLQSRFLCAQELARETGRSILSEVYRTSYIKNKDTRELVTEADREAENLIKESISVRYPDDGFLGEESGYEHGASEFYWVIDPIDGTTNYAFKLPFFCISIAVLRGGNPVVGVVYDPIRDQLYHAMTDAGAFCNDHPLAADQSRLTPTSVLGFSSRFTGTPPEHVTAFMTYFDEYRNFGSAALHLCYTAHGMLAGAFSDSTRLWDLAAAGLILTESGGILRDFQMNPIFPLDRGIDNYESDYTPFIGSGSSENVQQLVEISKQYS